MNASWLFIGLFCCITVYFLFRKLTPAGVAAALVMAITIYAGTGTTGLVLIGSFFLLGVLATTFGRHTKAAIGQAAPNKGKRTAGQVFANGGVALLLGAISWWLPQYQSTMILLIACAVSSATADTISSELGMVWGKNTFNIITFKKDRRGENGVISWEGTAAGVAASGLIAIVYTLFTDWNPQAFLIIIASGTIGNLADSYLGATLERKKVIGNNLVNFINTTVGAITGWLFYHLFKL